MRQAKEIERVNRYLVKMGQTGLDGGRKLLQRGKTLLAIVVLPQEDRLLFTTPVLDLPEENLLPLFRRLLDLNLEISEGAAFAINEDAGTIDLRISRTLKDLDQDEFNGHVNGLLEAAGRFDYSLATEYDARRFDPNGDNVYTWFEGVSAGSPAGSMIDAEAGKRRISRMRMVFAFLAIPVAAAAGYYAYTRFDSWAVALFTYFWVQYFSTRAVPDLITDPHKIRRLIYFSLYPGIATAILYLIHRWWEIWWLGAIVGTLLAMVIGPVIGAIFLPGTTREEIADDQERYKGFLKMHGGGSS